MEHPTLTAGTVEAAAPWRLLDLFTPGLVRRRLVEVGMCLAPEAQRERECGNAVVHVKPVLDGDATAALQEWLAALARHQTPREPAVLMRQMLRSPGGLLLNLARHALGRPKRFRIRGLRAEVRTEQEPNPESRVTLSRARDALGLPMAHVHWALTERDRLTMQVMTEVFAQELERLGLGRLLLAEWAEEIRRWPADLVGGHHHMGTTRMSATADTGVVDANCRSHSVDNLYLAGSSVFPTGGFVNPTPTILALALRLAEHIKARCSPAAGDRPRVPATAPARRVEGGPLA
jgi:choline dehydrogenase-like flavoprotein